MRTLFPTTVTLAVIFALAATVGFVAPAVAEPFQEKPDWFNALSPYFAAIGESDPAVQAEVEMAQSIASYADAADVLPDPTISAGVQALPTSLDPTQEPMTQAPVFGVRQSIPYPGKLSARERMLKAESAIAGQQAGFVAESRGVEGAAVAFRLEQAQRELLYVDQSIDWLNLLIRSARTRYETGKGMAYDLDQLKVELGKMKAERSRLVGRLAEAKARWKRLFGIAPPEHFVLDDGEKWQIPRDVTAAVLKHNPALEVAGKRVSASEAKVAVEKAGYGPDLFVELGYGFRGDGRDDFMTGKVGATVPLYAPWSQSRQVKGAEQAKQAAQSRIEDLRRQIVSDVAELEAMHADALRRQQLFQSEILPAAKAARLSATAGYDAGGASVLAPIDAVRREIQVLREYAALLAERRTIEARVMATAGELVTAAGKNVLSEVRDEN